MYPYPNSLTVVLLDFLCLFICDLFSEASACAGLSEILAESWHGGMARWHFLECLLMRLLVFPRIQICASRKRCVSGCADPWLSRSGNTCLYAVFV